MNTGTKIFLILFSYAILLAPEFLPAAQQKETDNDRILTILFPETTSWISVKDLPRVPPEDLKKLEPALRKAYLESNLGQDKYCGPDFSILDRLFSNARESPGFEDTFYQIDVDHDGIDDVMYSGPDPCLTSDATVIWFGGSNGYAIRQPGRMLIRVLRFAPGKPLLLGSVSVGCCGSLNDQYFLGEFERYHQAKKATMFRWTIEPPVVIKSMPFTFTGNELVLRLTPSVEDDYNEGRSEYLDAAAFGNIIAKYVAGATGTVLGTNGKDGNDLWYFVFMDIASNPRRTHNPYGKVNEGWVKASSITLGK